MTNTIHKLTNLEYNVLNKISRRTKMDCWFMLKEDCHGNDYVFDLENHKRMTLRSGVKDLISGLDKDSYAKDCDLDPIENSAFIHMLYNMNLLEYSKIKQYDTLYDMPLIDLADLCENFHYPLRREGMYVIIADSLCGVLTWTCWINSLDRCDQEALNYLDNFPDTNLEEIEENYFQGYNG